MNKLVLLFSIPLLGISQTTNIITPTPGGITKIVRVHNASAERIASMMFLSGGANIHGDNALGAIALRGDPALVAEIEKNIQELDRRLSSDIEVTAYILGATNKSQASAPVGKDLDPVVKQLTAIFPYTSYELLDTVLLRSTTGSEVKTGGSLRLPGERSSNGQYFINYRVETGALGGSRSFVALNHFDFSALIQSDKPNLTTNLDIQSGQKVVVGKMNIANGESALFVILTARVLD